MSRTDPFDGASPSLAVALTVRFLLELALLAGAAALALNLASDRWRWPAAILAVAGVAIVWGLFLSPKAPVSIPSFVALAMEAVLFLAVGVGLLAVGLGAPAGVGVIIWLVDRLALALLQR